jgi:hypothetical protein
MFGCNKAEDKTQPQRYVKKWSSAMNDAYTFASENTIKNSSKGKRHDKGVRYSMLKPGDCVLVRNLSERDGPGKLRSHWEKDIHIVLNCMLDSPVYKVKPESKRRKETITSSESFVTMQFPTTHQNHKKKQAQKPFKRRVKAQLKLHKEQQKSAKVMTLRF